MGDRDRLGVVLNLMCEVRLRVRRLQLVREEGGVMHAPRGNEAMGGKLWQFIFPPRQTLPSVHGGRGQFWLYTLFLEQDLEQERSLTSTKMRHTTEPKRVDSRREQLSPQSTH